MLPGNRRPRRRGQNARLAGGCPSTPRSRLPGSPDVAETGGDGRGVTAGSGAPSPALGGGPSARLFGPPALGSPVACGAVVGLAGVAGGWPLAWGGLLGLASAAGGWPLAWGGLLGLAGAARGWPLRSGRLFRVGCRRGRAPALPSHQLGRHGQRGPRGLETRMGLASAPRRVTGSSPGLATGSQEDLCDGVRSKGPTRSMTPETCRARSSRAAAPQLTAVPQCRRSCNHARDRRRHAHDSRDHHWRRGAKRYFAPSRRRRRDRATASAIKAVPPWNQSKVVQLPVSAWKTSSAARTPSDAAPSM